MPNVVGPNVFQHDLIASYTGSSPPWSDIIAGSTTIVGGPDAAGGFVFGSESSLNLFDLRIYKRAFLIWTGTFANAVTLQVGLNVYPSADIAVATLGPTYCTTPSSGGPAMACLGAPALRAASGADTVFGGASVFSPAPPLWARVRFYNSGATGVITGGGLYLYGVR